MLNKLLSKKLNKVFNLLTPEEYAEEYGLDLEGLLDTINEVNKGYGLDIVGLLSLKPGYEDNSVEADGSFYGRDGKIYLMYGWSDWRVIDLNEDYILKNIVKTEEDI